ncbi:hypothetical protein HG535_0G02030 [Zygotorulaspora mrakii]|uniref:DASH complex subunit DUO1 n=1 Tax=Zygotorulaspora mrakii TaxID=42260 RepID=A0A7H9B8K7_ZYGMR|nr:uncharacterized protein HG535_0G02030 [Zygotorulaspora mrakii]QLG74319.1 hypothetical protein HG535_0G02030 [Zygotorulaspora mrakii]
MDSYALDKLIPQMFDEMRYNLGNKGTLKKPAADKSSSSIITTQSLLKELAALDKIIPMIESVDSSLQTALPSHFDKIQEICKSTNTVLDSWINIHSQAGHIHELMGSTEYLKYASAQSKDGQTVNAKELIQAEEEEIESLKQEIVREKDKQYNANNEIVSHSKSSIPNSGRVDKNRKKPGSAFSRYNKSQGTPRINSRLTRPTVSSSRKMFR